MLVGQRNAGIGVKFGIFLGVLVCIFAAYFAVAEMIIVYPPMLSVGAVQDATVPYTVGLNNTASDVNLTQINITLPAGITFQPDSNGTDAVGADFLNDSNTLSWTNGAGVILNQSQNNFYFDAIANSSMFGDFNITVTSLDSNGIVNSSNFVVTVTDSAPWISITSPANGTVYAANVSELNYSVYDTNLASCWYSIDGGQTNTTVICGDNVTGLVDSEGSNTWTVWANDTSGGESLDSATFVRDTTYPMISFDNSVGYADGRYISSTSVPVGVTVVEANPANITYNLFNSDSSLNGSVTLAMANQNANNGYTWTGLSEGIYYYNVSVVDAVGHGNQTGIKNITIDRTNPVVSFVEPPTAADGANLSQKNVYALVNVTETYEEHIIFAIYDSGNSLVNQTIFYSPVRDINWTGLADGRYSYKVCVVDRAGNSGCTDDFASIRLINLDATAPNATLLTPANNTYANSNARNFTANLSDNFSGIRNATLNIYNSSGLVNQTTTNYGGTTNVVVGVVVNLVDNVYSWFYNLFDFAGNQFTTANNTLTIDTTNPLVSFGSGTSNTGVYVSRNWIYANISAFDLNEANIIFDLWNSTSQVNTTTLPAGTRTINWTGLVDGVYYYNATVVDLAGNRNSTVTENITLDTAISAMWTAGANAADGSNVSRNWIYARASFVTEPNPANVTFRLFDSSGNSLNVTMVPSAAVNAVNWTGLADGVYYYNFTAADLASNSYDSSTRKITLDTANPNGTLVSPMNNSYVNNQTQNYSTNLNDSLSGLKNATLNIINSTGSTVNQTTVGFGGQTGAAVGVVVNLVDGVYRWFYNLFDFAGNQFTTANDTITVDTVLPLVQIVVPSEINWSYVSKSNIIVNVTASDINLANVTIDLFNLAETNVYENVSAGSNYVNVLGLADGVYWFNATARDLAGNSNSTETRRVTLDTTNPLVDFGANTAVDGANLSQSNVYVDIAVTEINEANVSFDLFNSTGLVNQTTFAAGSRTINWTGLADGVYYYNATVVDLANNQNTTATRKITLDTASPNGNLIAPANNSYVNNPNQNYTASLTDNLGIKNATLNIYNSSGLVNSTTVNYGSGVVTTTVGVVVSLVDSVYSWFYNVFDWAGNSFMTGNNTITVDTVNPAIVFVNPSTTTGYYNNSRYWIDANISVRDVNLNNANVYFYNSSGLLNQAAIVGGNSRSLYQNWAGLAEGWYYVNASADDLAGNRNSTETRTIVLDSTNPLLTVFNPLDGTLFNVSQIQVTLIASDAVSGLRECDYRYSIGIGAPAIFTSPCSNITMDFGANQGMNGQLIITARDMAGNTNTTIRNFGVDTVAPAILINLPSNNQWLNSHNVNVNLTINDATSGVNSSTIDIRNSSGAIIDSSTNSNSGNFAVTLNVPADGIYSIFATSTDNAGNTGVVSANITIDTVNPSVVLNGPADGALVKIGDVIYYNWTASDAMSPTVNCTLLLGNVSGNYIVNNGVAFATTIAGPVASQYFWNVTCSDLAGNVQTSATRSIVYDLIAPTVNLLNPGDNAYVNYSNVNFTANVSDNIDVDNATFNLFNSTGSLINQQVFNFAGTTTNVVVGTVVNLVDGVYSWFYGAVDWLSNSATSATNTMTVDTTWPLISIASPTNSNYTMTAIPLSYNIVETNPNSCWWALNGGINNSVACGQGATMAAIQGWNSVAVYASDLAGHLNSSSVSFFVDSLGPVISYITPTEGDGSNISRNNIIVNVNGSDSGIGLANITVRIYNSSSLISSTTTQTSPNLVNLNGLVDGAYRFDATAYDRLGNTASLPMRNVIIDTIGPTLNLSQGVYEKTYMNVYVNGNDVGTGLNGTCTANRGVFDSAAGRIVDSSLTCETNYTYVVTCWDYAGNAGNATATFATASCVSGSAPTGSSGGGGGGGTRASLVNVYTPDSQSFMAGTEYTKTIPLNGMFSFTVDGISGYVAVVDINEKTVKIIVASGLQQEATMTIGDTEKFDIDSDGYYDIQVTLNAINGSSVEITVKYIHEKMLEDSSIKVGSGKNSGSGITGNAVNSSGSGMNWNWVPIAVVVIIVIAVVAILSFVVSVLRKK